MNLRQIVVRTISKMLTFVEQISYHPGFLRESLFAISFLVNVHWNTRNFGEINKTCLESFHDEQPYSAQLAFKLAFNKFEFRWRGTTWRASQRVVNGDLWVFFTNRLFSIFDLNGTMHSLWNNNILYNYFSIQFWGCSFKIGIKVAAISAKYCFGSM